MFHSIFYCAYTQINGVEVIKTDTFDLVQRLIKHKLQDNHQYKLSQITKHEKDWGVHFSSAYKKRYRYFLKIVSGVYLCMSECVCILKRSCGNFLQGRMTPQDISGPKQY